MNWMVPTVAIAVSASSAWNSTSERVVAFCGMLGRSR